MEKEVVQNYGPLWLLNHAQEDMIGNFIYFKQKLDLVVVIAFYLVLVQDLSIEETFVTRNRLIRLIFGIVKVNVEKRIS